MTGTTPMRVTGLYRIAALLSALVSSQPQGRERRRQRRNSQRHQIVTEAVRCGGDGDHGDHGDHVCPTRTTCCGDSENGYICLPTSTLYGGSVCCHDDDGDGKGTRLSSTGCPPGYACESSSSQQETSCRKQDASPAWRARGNPMPPLDEVGRVKPCHLPSGSVEKVHVLPIPPPAPPLTEEGARAGDQQEERRQSPLLFPYFSTRGDLSAADADAFPEVRLAVVAIHGSRNLYEADAYLCLAQAASSLQTTYEDASIVFVAPLYMGVKGAADNVTALWQRSGLAEEDERRIPRWRGYNPWVHGAVGRTSDGQVVGSYEVLDAFVDLFSNRESFPNLDGIVVVGNDIVQRWALLSSNLAWEEAQGQPHLRAVAISPTRFAYPTPMRYGGKDWRTPEELVASGAAPPCDGIDRWPHGLGGYEDVNPALPYGDRLHDVLGLSGDDASQASGLLLDRYARRDVVYLIGELETAPLSSEAGLRIPFQCADAYQGTHRYDRAARFFRALVEGRGGVEPAHRMMIAERVGHEMSMVYQSPCGVEALFGGWGGEGATAFSSCHPMSHDAMYKSCVEPDPVPEASSEAQQEL